MKSSKTLVEFIRQQEITSLLRALSYIQRQKIIILVKALSFKTTGNYKFGQSSQFYHNRRLYVSSELSALPLEQEIISMFRALSFTKEMIS